MAVPSDVKTALSKIIWKEADELDWTHISIHQKAVQYKFWAQDERIGQVLSRYMPIERVHPYIKDSMLKAYANSKKLHAKVVLGFLHLDSSARAAKYKQPFGIRLDDGKIVCWGRALDWKIILLAIFERSLERSSYSAHSVILTDSHGKFASTKFQGIVKEAARKLEIDSVHFR